MFVLLGLGVSRAIVERRASATAPAPAGIVDGPEHASDELPRTPAGPGPETAAASPFSGGGFGSLAVTVRSRRDRSPLPGVQVDVVAFEDRSCGRRRLSAPSDAAGVARFGSVPAGASRIFAAGSTKPAALDPGASGAVELLVDPPQPVTVLVTGADGTPLAGADVWASFAGAAERGAAIGKTDGDGRLVVTGAAPGASFAARSESLGWSPRRRRAEDGPRGPEEVRIPLRAPARSLRGSVVDESGAPVAGAWVACRRIADETAGPPAVEAGSASDGSFAVEGLTDGTWSVEAWHERFAPALARVALEGADASAPVVLALRAGASIEGCARDEAGRPLARVVVSVRADGFLGRVGQAVTGADGTYRIAGLPESVVSARAGLIAGEPVHASLDLRAAGRSAWDPKIGTGAMVAGAVTDENGAARAFAIVRARAADGGSSWFAETVADRTGRFEIANAPAGTVVVEVEIAGWPEGNAWTVEALDRGRSDLAIAIPGSARPSAHLSGRLLDASGNPKPGVLVAAVRGPVAARLPATAFSQEPDGSFRIGPLAPGSWIVETPARSGTWAALAERTVGAGEESDLGEVRLRGEGFLKVFVKGAIRAGGPRDLAVVDRLGRRVAALRPVAGFAASGPLAPGGYVLAVGARGATRNEIAFEVREGATTMLEIGDDR
jgi:Carboxypeptidase regulatory-like domain